MSHIVDLREKYASEARIYTFQFGAQDEIVAGQTISSVTGITGTPAGLTIGAGAISGTNVTSTISSGTAGQLYTVTCTVVTNLGAILVVEGLLQVLTG